MSNYSFHSGLDITPSPDGLDFIYGPDIFGPSAEYRSLDAIRESLMDPACQGPDPVYAIAMDVGKNKHRDLLVSRHLLFGVVIYAAGRLGREPVRSQGHVHKISPYSNNWSTPEVYEIWRGKAVIYMQEKDETAPGRCFAVYANPGDVVIVPPGWAHATISADPKEPLIFGAWCDRDYGFVYDGVRKHKGLAWYPLLNEQDELEWKSNPNYHAGELVKKYPEDYQHFGITPNKSIYQIFEDDPETFLFVSKPQLKASVWKNFVP